MTVKVVPVQAGGSVDSTHLNMVGIQTHRHHQHGSLAGWHHSRMLHVDIIISASCILARVSQQPSKLHPASTVTYGHEDIHQQP